MKINVEELASYKNYGKALKLSTDKVEIVVTLDVGIRIMHLSLPGQPNILQDDAGLSEKLPDGREWTIKGGHRTWHSPEAFPRSYLPDDAPLESYELTEKGIIMVQKPEDWAQMGKTIEVVFEEDGSLRVINTITNNNAWPIEMAVWALALGSCGGREVVPVVQRDAGLQTNTGYRSWAYSRMNDPRVHWGQRYITVDCDANDKTAFKFGYGNEYGWMTYFNHDQCFVKKFPYVRGAKYPDEGCSYETYSSYFGIELESLTPLQIVKAGKSLSHEETWYILESKGLPDYDEDAIAQKLAPIAKATGIELPVISAGAWDPTFEED